MQLGDEDVNYSLAMDAWFRKMPRISLAKCGVHRPPKKRTQIQREKLLNHPEPNFLRLKSHTGNSADGIESLAEDGLKLSFAKPLVKQGLFGGRVLKDTIKRHVDPDDYRS